MAATDDRPPPSAATPPAPALVRAPRALRVLGAVAGALVRVRER